MQAVLFSTPSAVEQKFPLPAFNHCLPCVQNTCTVTWLPQAVQSWAWQFPNSASHFGGNVGVMNAEGALSVPQTETRRGAGSCLTMDSLSTYVKTSSLHCQMLGSGTCLFVYHLCWNKPSRNASLSSHTGWSRNWPRHLDVCFNIGHLQWTQFGLVGLILSSVFYCCFFYFFFGIISERYP